MSRSRTVQVRVTAADKKAWTKLAKADGRTLSDWIRLNCNVYTRAMSTAKVKRKGPGVYEVRL
jgi:mRNA-degrading endonuclease RelE of RelBE toxin-antitoxin system